MGEFDVYVCRYYGIEFVMSFEDVLKNLNVIRVH